jgi:hypothetical protein
MYVGYKLVNSAHFGLAPFRLILDKKYDTRIIFVLQYDFLHSQFSVFGKNAGRSSTTRTPPHFWKIGRFDPDSSLSPRADNRNGQR